LRTDKYKDKDVNTSAAAAVTKETRSRDQAGKDDKSRTSSNTKQTSSPGVQFTIINFTCVTWSLPVSSLHAVNQ